MKAQDLSTITAVGVLAAALAAFLAGFDLVVPLWVPALAPLIAGVILFALRAYIAIVGAEQTSVDEKLEAAQKLIDSARLFASEAPTRPDRRR